MLNMPKSDSDYE